MNECEFEYVYSRLLFPTCFRWMKSMLFAGGFIKSDRNNVKDINGATSDLNSNNSNGGGTSGGTSGDTSGDTTKTKVMYPSND